NHPEAAMGLAGELIERLGVKADASLADSLEALCLAIFQRPPTPAESEQALAFVERRRAASGKPDPRSEVLEFAGLLLCANEAIYLE
ncbi:MAG: hypothetical protein KDM91_21755, partial [Verrucomicrobiae bacterium]|nr:hypothetical protein [Verrucomicrobiae bacterium]